MMTMMLILLFGAAGVLLLPTVFERYVRRLPDAPICPGCRALTRASSAAGLAALFLPMFSTTVMRECGVCGWRGRMRLRLAAEGARGG
jgi:hypothetical protein